MGNKNLQLSYANISNYPTPWTMWGGPTFKPGSHIGNVKIGPANTTCPEHFSVRLLSINLHFCICVALNTNVSMRRFLMLLMYGIGSNTYIFCSLRNDTFESTFVCRKCILSTRLLETIWSALPQQPTRGYQFHAVFPTRTTPAFIEMSQVGINGMIPAELCAFQYH